jgi:hypothetical protein
LLSQSRPRTSDYNSHRSDARRQVGCLLWSEANPAAIKHSEVFYSRPHSSNGILSDIHRIEHGLIALASGCGRVP